MTTLVAFIARLCAFAMFAVLTAVAIPALAQEADDGHSDDSASSLYSGSSDVSDDPFRPSKHDDASGSYSGGYEWSQQHDLDDPSECPSADASSSFSSGCNAGANDNFDDEEHERALQKRQTFQGFNCTVDCSGHQAGYDWGTAHGLTDPSQCSGNSQSFIEGCEAAAGQRGPNGED